MFPEEEIKVKKLRVLPVSLRSRSGVQISFLWLRSPCFSHSTSGTYHVTKWVQVERTWDRRGRWRGEYVLIHTNHNLPPTYAIKRKSNTDFLCKNAPSRIIPAYNSHPLGLSLPCPQRKGPQAIVCSSPWWSWPFFQLTPSSPSTAHRGTLLHICLDSAEYWIFRDCVPPVNLLK